MNPKNLQKSLSFNHESNNFYDNMALVLQSRNITDNPDLFSITKNLDQIPKNIKGEYMTRYRELKTYLKQRYDTKLRDDSKLAWKYISNPYLILTLEDVAKELWYMKILYAYTNYAEKCQHILPSVKRMFITKNTDGTPSQLVHKRCWEHIQNYVIPTIKLECMSELIGKTLK